MKPKIEYQLYSLASTTVETCENTVEWIEQRATWNNYVEEARTAVKGRFKNPTTTLKELEEIRLFYVELLKQDKLINAQFYI